MPSGRRLVCPPLRTWKLLFLFNGQSPFAEQQTTTTNKQETK
jgi:hypothetical protein